MRCYGRSRCARKRRNPSWVRWKKFSLQERQQRLYEASKNEGQAVDLRNMDVSAMKPLTDGFMKRYPGKKRQVHFSGASIITARFGSPAGSRFGCRSERAVRRLGADR